MQEATSLEPQILEIILALSGGGITVYIFFLYIFSIVLKLSFYFELKAHNGKRDDLLESTI